MQQRESDGVLEMFAIAGATPPCPRSYHSPQHGAQKLPTYLCLPGCTLTFPLRCAKGASVRFSG